VKFEKIQAETEKGLLFIINKKEVWFPKQYIAVDLQHRTLAVPSKMATEKGLLDNRLSKPDRILDPDKLRKAISQLKRTGKPQSVEYNEAAIENYMNLNKK
jgi:hypothetical protein